MIKSITVTNHLGEELTLELTRPEKSGFRVTGVDGLGPVKSTINTNKLARSHGSRYSSSYLDMRNIVINLEYHDVIVDERGNVRAADMEDLRHKTYQYFPENTEIKLSIVTDTRSVYTMCYVEHNDAEIFSARVGSAITLVCPDPYLYASGYETISFNMEEPAFEFEFPFRDDEEAEKHKINEIEYVDSDTGELVEGIPAIEFSTIRDVFTRGIYYHGDYNVGVKLHLYMYGEVINPQIINRLTGDVMRINTSKIAKIMGTETGLMNGDIIEIDTNHMNKSIALFRDGIHTNILNCLDKDTKWLSLARGNNQITCIASEDSNGVDTSSRLSVNMTYNVVYGGI